MTTPALGQFRTELVAAAHQPHGESAPRSLPLRRRALVLGALAAVTLGGGTAAAVTLINNAPDSPYDPVITSPRVTGKARTLSRAEREALKRRENAGAPILDATRYFAVLKRSPTTADRVPRRINQSGIRLAASGPLGRVYIRSTARKTCVLSIRRGERGATGSCAPTAIARTRGVVVWEQCFKRGAPQHRYVAGVVPDGVRTVSVSRKGAQQARASVQHNGFMLDTIQPFDTLKTGNASTPLPPVSC